MFVVCPVAEVMSLRAVPQSVTICIHRVAERRQRVLLRGIHAIASTFLPYLTSQNGREVIEQVNETSVVPCFIA